MTCSPASTTTNDTAEVKPLVAIGSTPSVSKDDALTERLRVLRNASSTSVPSSASPGSGQAPTASPKPEPDTRRKGHDSAQPLPKGGQTPVSPNIDQNSSHDQDTKTHIQTQILSSAWGLEEIDDQALDELLEGLHDDLNLQEDVPAEEDIDIHAIANNNNNYYYDDDDGIIENDEHKVQKLLSELTPKPNNNSFAADDDDDDDDSDGEAMAKETNRILNQVHDEINLSSRPTDDKDNTNDDDPFSLPSPPSGTRTPTFTSTSQPTSPKQEPSLTLPTVPSSSGGNQVPVIDDIPSLTARLSHLRSTPIKTDAFGLPSVPTTTLILPADSSFSFPPPSASAGGPGLSSTKYQTKSTRGWVGRNESYTDEDTKKWCKVCLEDATIRCEGCEDEGYCGRCWREMHVGPAAGWEERGHRWFRL